MANNVEAIKAKENENVIKHKKYFISFSKQVAEYSETNSVKIDKNTKIFLHGLPKTKHINGKDNMTNEK